MAWPRSLKTAGPVLGLVDNKERVGPLSWCCRRGNPQTLLFMFMAPFKPALVWLPEMHHCWTSNCQHFRSI